MGGRKRKRGRPRKKQPAIMVKVARSGSPVKEVAVNGTDPTVEDALTAAGIRQKESEEISVNGTDVDLDYELEEGDRVVLTKSIEGGDK